MVASQNRPNSLAVASLVLGVLSLAGLACCGCGGLAFGAAAVVTGAIARHRILVSRGAQTGTGLAAAGIVVGAVGAALGLLLGTAALSISVSPLLWPAALRQLKRIARLLGTHDLEAALAVVAV
jgi:hypothetical protein